MKLLNLTIALTIACTLIKAQNNDSLLTSKAPIQANSFSQNQVKLESSNLPIIFIIASNAGLESGEVSQGHMGIINNKDDRNNRTDRRNEYDRRIGISYYGSSALFFEKKSFLIETQRDNGDNFEATLLGMPRENDWILHAPYSDKSLLRNSVTHEMARKLGYYTSRIGYCEVILNGQYHGVYMLMETIKKDEGRLDLATLNTDDTVGAELSGSYIFKVDAIPPNYDDFKDGWRANNDYHDAMDFKFQHVYPTGDDMAVQQHNYIKSTVAEFETVLTSDKFNDPNNGYHKYIDVGSFVDYMLIHEITKSANAFNEGTYFYKVKDTKGGKIHAGPLSDFTFGYNNADYWNLSGLNSGYAHSDQFRVMFWWNRLMQDKYFYDLAYTRWVELRADKFSDESLFSHIDSVTNHINEARQRNFEQWPVLDSYVFPNSFIGEDYESEVQHVKDWLTNRMEWMDLELFGTALLPSASISNFTYTSTEKRAAIKVVLHDEYFNKNVLNKEFFNLAGLPYNVTVDSVIYTNASEALLVLSANATPESVTNELTLDISQNVLNGFHTVSSNNLVLSANKMGKDAQLKIYTANKTLVIKCNNPELLPNYIEVYNLTGQKVATQEIQKTQENRLYLNLTENIYLVKMSLDKKSVTQRINLKP